jgi:hypothetical protein
MAMPAIKEISAPDATAKRAKVDDCVQISGVTTRAGLAGSVRDGASVKIYPTSAGTATVKTSCSPTPAVLADIAANDFTTGHAKWDNWNGGNVTGAAIAVLAGTVTGVAVVPASGTWVLEVAQ